MNPFDLINSGLGVFILAILIHLHSDVGRLRGRFEEHVASHYPRDDENR